MDLPLARIGSAVADVWHSDSLTANRTATRRARGVAAPRRGAVPYPVSTRVALIPRMPVAAATSKGPTMTDPAAQPSAPQPGVPLTAAEDKQWGSLAHILGILGILPSLIIWLVFKDRGPFTNTEGKEALNFQITLIIAEVIGYITTPLFIGFLIIPAVYIVRIVFSIIAFLGAKDGINYRYPFALRLIK